MMSHYLDEVSARLIEIRKRICAKLVPKKLECEQTAEMSHRMGKHAKTKTQISFAVISTFVFATQIVQFLYLLNPKFQASSLLLWMYNLVCVRPGRKPKLLVFSRTGSNDAFGVTSL